MPELTVGSKVIPYVIRKSEKAKYVRITVGSEGVTVTAPSCVNETEVMSFINQKKDWINKKISACSVYNGFNSEHRFIDGEQLFFQGDSFTLRVVEYAGKSTKVVLKGEQFVVHINKLMPEADRKTAIRDKLASFYKRLARAAIVERVDYYIAALGVNYSSIRIKDQKTRWGSCSKQGNLNFNWRIVMAPSDIIDYVVVHELCHLIQMNHSKKFWHLVESHIPDYRERRRWLKQNSIALKF